MFVLRVVKFHVRIKLLYNIDSTNSTSSAKGHANQLSPTEAAMDGWNPMESHFLSNWNMYKESANNGWSDRGKGKTWSLLLIGCLQFVTGSLTYRARRNKQGINAFTPNTFIYNSCTYCG